MHLKFARGCTSRPILKQRALYYIVVRKLIIVLFFAVSRHFRDVYVFLVFRFRCYRPKPPSKKSDSRRVLREHLHATSPESLLLGKSKVATHNSIHSTYPFNAALIVHRLEIRINKSILYVYTACCDIVIRYHACRLYFSVSGFHSLADGSLRYCILCIVMCLLFIIIFNQKLIY